MVLVGVAALGIGIMLADVDHNTRSPRINDSDHDTTVIDCGLRDLPQLSIGPI